MSIKYSSNISGVTIQKSNPNLKMTISQIIQTECSRHVFILRSFFICNVFCKTFLHHENTSVFFVDQCVKIYCNPFPLKTNENSFAWETQSSSVKAANKWHKSFATRTNFFSKYVSDIPEPKQGDTDFKSTVKSKIHGNKCPTICTCMVYVRWEKSAILSFILVYLWMPFSHFHRFRYVSCCYMEHNFEVCSQAVSAHERKTCYRESGKQRTESYRQTGFVFQVLGSISFDFGFSISVCLGQILVVVTCFFLKSAIVNLRTLATITVFVKTLTYAWILFWPLIFEFNYYEEER